MSESAEKRFVFEQSPRERHWIGDGFHVSTQGPFVMNEPGEIDQAFADYREGKMGRLAD